MSIIIRNGRTFRVMANGAMDIEQRLAPGNYIIKMDMTGIYLEGAESFTPPKKIYGDTMQRAARILNTFLDRPNSTGIMLTGEKGSGKTLLAKMIAITSAETHQMPTIVVNQPFTGDSFMKFIQDIDQPAVVLFDEFEKVYDEDQQKQVLTLFDGVFPSKKLFIVTTNDKYRVNSHMRNRPGRLYYMLDYNGLTSDFIEEYCRENLKNKKYIEQVCGVACMFDQFNFDMLSCLIEEMNRYDESPQQALKLLNAKPEFNSPSTYAVTLLHKVLGEIVLKDHYIDDDWKGNPLTTTLRFDIFRPRPAHIKEEDYDAESDRFMFAPQNLVKIDPKNGRFIYEVNGLRLTLTKKPMEMISFPYAAL